MDKRLMLKERIRQLPPVVYMLLVLILGFGLASDRFLTLSNFNNILLQASPLLILAFGQTLVVLSQGTDLSVGAQISFVTVVWMTMARAGIPLIPAAGLALCSTCLIGTINGLIVAKGQIPPFIATFGMQSILSGAALLISRGSSVVYRSDFYIMIMESTLFGIRLPIYLAVGVFTVTWILLYRTRFGTNIFGLGGNPEALVLAGINTTKVYVKVYLYAGLLAGLAGLLTACRIESGHPTVGVGMEFESIAATLLGGTSLREGKGSLKNTIYGVLLLAVIKNGLNLIGISAVYQSLIIGLIMLAALVINVWIQRLHTAREGGSV